jgi:DNA polymerase III epsilon subunit family exonuclease
VQLFLVLFAIFAIVIVLVVALNVVSSPKSIAHPISTAQPDAHQETAATTSALPVDHQEAEAVESEPPDLSILPREFVVLDLETTGLDREKHEIIEMAALRVHVDTSTADSFQVLVKPEKRIPKRITELTGITQEMVEQDSMSLPDALPAFLDFLADSPLVIFNAEFDMGFLQVAASKQGLVIANRYACALKLARRAFPGLPSYKLQDLAERFNIPTDDNHRALADCKRAATIFGTAATSHGKQIRWSRLPVENNARQKAATTAG